MHRHDEFPSRREKRRAYVSLGPNAESRLYKIAHWARAFLKANQRYQGAGKPQQDHPNEETLGGSARIPRVDLGLVVQNHVQQGIMDLDFFCCIR